MFDLSKIILFSGSIGGFVGSEGISISSATFRVYSTSFSSFYLLDLFGTFFLAFVSAVFSLTFYYFTLIPRCPDVRITKHQKA